MKPRTALIIAVAVCAVGSVALFAKRRSMRAELRTLTAARAAADSVVINARLTVEVDRIRLQLERARSQPARTADAHRVNCFIQLRQVDSAFNCIQNRSTATEFASGAFACGQTKWPSGDKNWRGKTLGNLL